jgi:hypothetical protein
VFLKRAHGWTVGILANQIRSGAGEEGRARVNATFLQPFLPTRSRTDATITLNSESTYDWQIGGLPVSFQIGGRRYAEGPVAAPHWGMRFAVTPLFRPRAATRATPEK